MVFLILGALIVLLGVWDIKDGDSDFFFGPSWLNDYIHRDETPVLFWICIGIYMSVGFSLMGVGIYSLA